jgi:transposase
MEKVDTKSSDKILKTEVFRMKGIPQGRYKREFREEAVKLVTEGNMSLPETARRLSLPPSTLANWLKAYKAGKLGEVGKTKRPPTEIVMELARTKRELAETRMELEILKKAAAYFAKESLPGTRK